VRLKASLSATVLLLVASAAPGEPASPSAPWPGEARFRDIYRELVETDTTHSAGSCTRAAQRMAARLAPLGLPAADLRVVVPPGFAEDGSLIARVPGRDARAKPILLLAHLDVVEARREDWTRDPFRLVEEHGEFYARGASDDKSMAAIWVDLLLRLADERYRPRRGLTVALTCGEESGARINTVEWLLAHEPAALEAAFAINEYARGELDAAGRRVALEIQAGEKFSQSYRLEVTNPGGHSSRPLPDNAIYRLAGALKRLEAYEFPVEFTEASRGYFAGMAKILAGRGETTLATALATLVRDPADRAAATSVAQADPSWNAMLRTTCVATMLEAGHALNALPQRARASVNCRLFPGSTVASVREALVSVVADPAVSVAPLAVRGAEGVAPPALTAAIVGPVEAVAREFWPGVPILPVLQPAGTDGKFLNAAGIPTYGIEPIFVGPDLGNVHGLNEHVGVTALLEGREFLYRLVKRYADAP
jgi:acetylornithine deacetylase/succinyl-diaminopimelate desuccinylase-like protein